MPFPAAAERLPGRKIKCRKEIGIIPVGDPSGKRKDCLFRLLLSPAALHHEIANNREEKISVQSRKLPALVICDGVVDIEQYDGAIGEDAPALYRVLSPLRRFFDEADLRIILRQMRIELPHFRKYRDLPTGEILRIVVANQLHPPSPFSRPRTAGTASKFFSIYAEEDLPVCIPVPQVISRALLLNRHRHGGTHIRTGQPQSTARRIPPAALLPVDGTVKIPVTGRIVAFEKQLHRIRRHINGALVPILRRGHQVRIGQPAADVERIRAPHQLNQARFQHLSGHSAAPLKRRPESSSIDRLKCFFPDTVPLGTLQGGSSGDPQGGHPGIRRMNSPRQPYSHCHNNTLVPKVHSGKISNPLISRAEG